MPQLKLKIKKVGSKHPITKQLGFAARYIVDLGPIGKLYPSCSSGWYEDEKDMKLEDVKPTLYYRAGDDVEAAVKSAKLVWAKAGEEDEEEENEGGTPSGEDTPGGGDSGGGNNGGSGGFDTGD